MCVCACVHACVCMTCVMSCSWNLATLRQQRRAVLVEMTVRQQHMDNQNEIRRESESEVAPGHT